MKVTKNTNKSIFFQLITFSVLIIIICKIFQYFTNKKENFTSGFREMYRPYLRNIRLIGENYYTKIKQTIQLFFRKFGLI
jgi:hypothetical protein